ncbi:MAG: SRPBCC family protein [Cognaticolwellia sp.]
MKNFSISKEITINAKPEVVFDALTTSDEIIKYYPLNNVISTWKLGEPVHYKGEVNGDTFTDYGVITELRRPTVYAYRYWSDNHGTENTLSNNLNIKYTMLFIDGVTQLTLIQNNIKSEEMFNVMDNVVWDMLLSSLKKHIESGI